jgi:hypothetical protein
MTGYSTDKEPTSPPPTEQIGPYRDNSAPAGARFNEGAKDLGSIKEMLDARRRHNEALSKRDIGPANPAAGHDAKQK